MKRTIARAVFWTIAVVMLLVFVGCITFLVVAASTATADELLRGVKHLAIFVTVSATIITAFIWALENK